MKRQITFEQWTEITAKQAGILLEKMALKFNADGAFTDFPDIGDMIGFLNEHYQTKHFHIQKDNKKGIWNTYFDIYFDEGKEELCDALWEAVKKVINEEI